MSQRIAPAGAIWVCGACGKTAKDRYGEPGSSWDESCMLNAVLCHEHKKFDERGRLEWHAYSLPSTHRGSEPSGETEADAPYFPHLPWY